MVIKCFQIKHNNCRRGFCYGFKREVEMSCGKYNEGK